MENHPPAADASPGGRFRPTTGICLAMLVLLLASAALMLRVHELDRRPFHSDEAVQAVKTGELYDSGHYRYDPFEHHGPSLYYLTLPTLKLSGADRFAGADDADFRIIPAVFGAALILLLLPLRRDLGPVAVLTAAALIAVSPAMVFYSRYYIQEMLLVFFSGLTLCAVWKYRQSQRLCWMVAAGFAAGMMFATKETSVISFGAMGAACGWLMLQRRLRSGPVSREWHKDIKPMLLAALIAAGVAILFFSSFFHHPRGVLDSLMTFYYYVHRSGGDGSEALHRQPWHYYLEMLAYTRSAPGPWWSEGLILALAVIGIITTFCRRLPTSIHPDLAMLLVVYTVCLTAAYAVIPYKTPWNLLGFLHGLILVAGIGAAAIYHLLSHKAARAMWILLLMAGIWQLAGQAWQATHRFSADPRNPYVYAHSAPDVIRLSERIHAISMLHPEKSAMPVHFIGPDYWPMPYYLRDLQRVGYWNDIPSAPDAPVIIVGAEMNESLEPMLHDSYRTEFFGLRPGVLVILHIRHDLWEAYLQNMNPGAETTRPPSP